MKTIRSRTTSSVALAVTLALATGAPVAVATPAQQLYGPPGRPNQEKQVVVARAPVGAPAAIVRVSAPVGGFDWGDAGIGAIGGLAISLIGVGGAVAVSQHRTRRSQSDVTA